MILGILKETEGEQRVSLLPEQVASLVQQNLSVWVEAGAGLAAHASDEAYRTAGALIKNRNEVLSGSQLLLSFGALATVDSESLVKGAILIGVYQPLSEPQRVAAWADKGYTVFSLDMMPRTTRAQSMDVLSSQANIAGYKAVLLAASLYPRYFPMFMTAAGSIAPAKVLVLGAGVAGLQAIATAKRLGAVVEVSDTRPAVKEEVMSLGAKFIEVEGAADASQAGGYAVEQSAEFLEKQKARLAQSVAKSDIIIATAQIPGRKAPVLVPEAMLQTMRPGSVVVDLAASTGGNVFGVVNNATVQCHGVTLVGNSQLAGTVPADASKLYGKNLLNFLKLILDKEGAYVFNAADDIVAGCCMARDGQIQSTKIQQLLNS